MKNAIIPILSAALLAAAPVPATAQESSGWANDVVSVELLDGWRETSGQHIAAIRVTLAEGWKTYWRAPGDGGLPTHLDWHASENLSDLRILWPRPMVFETDGMRSLGYRERVVLPIELTPDHDGDIQLDARLNFGICKEVCVPVAADLTRVFTPQTAAHIDTIRTALDAAPAPSEQAGIDAVTCMLKQTDKGHQLSVELHASLGGGASAMIVETVDPEIWVSRTDLVVDGDHWHGVTQLYDNRATPARIDPADLRITLLTEAAAIDILGCSAP